MTACPGFAPRAFPFCAGRLAFQSREGGVRGRGRPLESLNFGAQRLHLFNEQPDERHEFFA
jgi:hypothetical protein